jgi:Tol biopolymer transport system component
LGKSTCLRVYYLFLLFAVLIVGCGSNEPQPIQAVIAQVTETAVSTATSVPSHTPSPTNTASLTDTATVTKAPASTQTPIPLPLNPMTPFPTVTPDYVEYETKPVFIALTGWGGDGGGGTDYVLGRDTPSLIIYGDGQMIITDRSMGDRIYLETYLSPSEMCQLRQEIKNTGFLEPHETFFTERVDSMGGGQLSIQVEDTYYSFDSGDVQFLVESLATGYQLIRDFQPQNSLVPYVPKYLILWLEEVEPNENDVVAYWPTDLPSLSELWSNREQKTILIEDELALSILDLFNGQNTRKQYQEEAITYSIIARPLLPHETPYRYPVFPSLPRDYVTVLNCDDEPTLISSSMPTATPTLIAPADGLSGQGRIVFAFGLFNGEQEIYVMEADGTNRLRLTNNRFLDNEPVWSPDGQRIAFVSERDRNRDIFVMNADGTDMIQLTNNISDNYSPTWSPDGTKIAFVSDRDGGWDKSEIYVMNTDGSDQVRLTNNDARDLQPVWSPDGRKIAFIQELEYNISSALVVLHLETSISNILYVDKPAPNEERKSYIVHRISRPAWSPDSTQIGITLFPNLPSIIYILNLNGTEVQTFAVSPLEQRDSLDWTANGRYIVFSARGSNEDEDAIRFSEDESYPGDWDIYALDLATGEIIQITYSEQNEMSPALWP